MNTEVGQALGKAIKQARQETNLTQEELATRANVSVRLLQKYEAGKPRPRYETLFQLCHALNISPDTLIAPMFQQWKEVNKK